MQQPHGTDGRKAPAPAVTPARTVGRGASEPALPSGSPTLSVVLGVCPFGLVLGVVGARGLRSLSSVASTPAFCFDLLVLYFMLFSDELPYSRPGMTRGVEMLPL